MSAGHSNFKSKCNQIEERDDLSPQERRGCWLRLVEEVEVVYQNGVAVHFVQPNSSPAMKISLTLAGVEREH
jgi:hypothetical protein